MIHQPAIAQNYFLRSLEKIEALLPRLDTSLLVWLPWPWLRTIQQSSPTFWNWRNGVFEFVSDPTPAEGEGEQPFISPNELTLSKRSIYQNGSASQLEAASENFLPPTADRPSIGGLYGESASDGSGNIASSDIASNGSVERSSELPEEVSAKISEDFPHDFELEALLEEPTEVNSDLSEVEEAENRGSRSRRSLIHYANFGGCSGDLYQ